MSICPNGNRCLEPPRHKGVDSPQPDSGRRSSSVLRWLCFRTVLLRSRYRQGRGSPIACASSDREAIVEVVLLRANRWPKRRRYITACRSPGSAQKRGFVIKRKAQDEIITRPTGTRTESGAKVCSVVDQTRATAGASRSLRPILCYISARRRSRTPVSQC
jgi:hypothetical protein